MAKLLGKWWTGMRLTCRECGEVFALEAEDKPRHGQLYNTEVACPSCGEPVSVPRSYGQEIPQD